jgi:hypothetical protein
MTNEILPIRQGVSNFYRDAWRELAELPPSCGIVPTPSVLTRAYLAVEFLRHGVRPILESGQALKAGQAMKAGQAPWNPPKPCK